MCIRDRACTGGGTLAADTLTVDTSGTPIVCTYTNTGQVAGLSITKVASSPTVAPGGSLTYSIVARNDGVRHADGAVVRDPAVTGLTCTTVTCTPAGSAVCPGSPTVANLQGPGLTIPTLPVGGQVTLTLSCSVAP